MADGQELSGYDWLRLYMEAQARVDAEVMFFSFSLGQAGALGTGDPERARQMLDAMKTDAHDMKTAAENLHAVMLNIVANVERNLPK